jgi:mRNA-degrading endonuclease RelE of RelBE toxin-antitoxin system
MAYKVIEHPQFGKLVKKISKKYKTINEDLETAKDILTREPDIMADYIPGFHNKVGKLRMPISGAGIGKSGGCRIIFYKDENSHTIKLLFIYLKSEKEDISKEEIERALKEVESGLNE